MLNIRGVNYFITSLAYNIKSVYFSLAQVSAATGEWANRGENSGSVLPREIQPAAQISPLALPAGGPGAETHVSAPGGEYYSRFPDE